jgi:hypothetical protein
VCPLAAPRIDSRLVRAIELAPANASAADVTRAVGDIAWSLGLARPSYEQVRVRMRFAQGENQRVSDWDVLYDVICRTRPATDLVNRWYGDPLPWRQSAHNEPRRST